MVHLISYDLNHLERPSSYTDVRKLIEHHAVSYRRPLYSQWLVETPETAATWVERLLTVMDDADRLLVSQVKVNAYWGYLDKEVWEWLENRV